MKCGLITRRIGPNEYDDLSGLKISNSKNIGFSFLVLCSIGPNLYA